MAAGRDSLLEDLGKDEFMEELAMLGGAPTFHALDHADGMQKREPVGILFVRSVSKTLLPRSRDEGAVRY